MKPKKSLGQNFLTNNNVALEMLKAGEVKKGDLILEIGPGKGALTSELLKRGAIVVAIEKDSRLIPILNNLFQKEITNNSLEIKENDILNIDLAIFLKKLLKDKKKSSFKLIANIPYYITGAILERFLSCEIKPEKIVVLVQKEVADRVVANNKKESILSLATKLYGEPKKILKVSAGSFFPKPKVDSAILLIDIYKKSLILDKDLEVLYLKIIKAAFLHKRKIMLNNLKTSFPKVSWQEIFKILKIKESARAEDLKKDDFLYMAKLSLKDF